MLADEIELFHECFDVVEDPRVLGRSDHPLDSVLFVIVTAVIAGGDGPSDIQAYALEQQDWIEQFVDLPAGVPSHDTIGRILAMIAPDQFQAALLDWISRLRAEHTDSDGPVLIQIDGKTVRGSYTNAAKSNALHIVSAWASQYGLSLGQKATDSKSNELSVIPDVLEMLDLRGAIVTLDALGCQKSIAEKIIDGEGDYIFAVKDNHPKLAEAIEKSFTDAHEAGLIDSGFRSKRKTRKTRGREEERFYAIAPIDDELLPLTKHWPGAKSIGQAITTTSRGETTQTEVRYFLSSREAKVGEFADSVRSHWAIESMHWVLDVVFHEDSSRIRIGNATENLSFVRKFVTGLLKQDTTKVSLKQKRKRAGWNTGFLEKILFPA